MKLRCKMKGKKVVDKSDSNIEYACRFCNGEIEVEKKGDRVVFKKIQKDIEKVFFYALVHRWIAVKLT